MTIDITVLHDEIQTVGCPDWSTRLQVDLHENGDVTIKVAEVHSSERSSTPMDVWHKRVLRWSAYPSEGAGVVDPAKLTLLAEKLRPLLEIVAAGHEVEWNGSNHVGKMTEEAEEASDQIDSIVENWEWHSDDWSVWDAGEWMQNAWREIVERHKIRTGMTEEEIEAVVEALEAEAQSDCVFLQDTRASVDRLIERVAEEAEDQE